MERNIIRFAEKRIKIYQVYSQLLASFQRNVRVIANGLHVERLQTFCYIGAYTAHTDNTDCFIQKLDAGKAFAVPAAFHNGLVCLRDIAGYGKHKGKGMLTGGDCV